MQSLFSTLEPSFYEHLQRIIQITHHHPHDVLGLHECENQKVIRLWRPGAFQVFLELNGEIVEAVKIHDEGFFEYRVPVETTALDYRVYHQNGLLAHDPYAFPSTFGEIDQYLFGKGVHYELYNQMGGRLTSHLGVEGVKFSVWAPNAKCVSLLSDCNYWDGRANPMRVQGYTGVWEIFVPGMKEGEKYKFEIHTQQGERCIKADPYATYSEMRPATASIIASIDSYNWRDQQWIEARKHQDIQAKPLSIYEIHTGSWNQYDGNFLNYRDLAHNLASYCLEMGFTHVELMPIQEHPLDESWGYQVSGFFAPTSRHGSPQDFQYFVDYMHLKGIGVILDWVPGHFPTDAFSLSRFDGSALYEHADPRQGFHPHWQTNIFNFSRNEVTNFLIANALYWCEKMHIDGLRVDAVASMLYVDYGREESEWIPNIYGGRENLAAIEFLKHLNSVIHQRCPGVIMIAEESTSFPGVTQPAELGGLGFDFKWNMGWMNDTLRYFSKDPLYRTYHHHDLTFGLIYVFSENFICALSHDEVVHGKKSLISKMPGDTWQQFANLRLLLSYMICQPGKKSLFMGAELAQWTEWNCKKEMEWFLLDFPVHKNIFNLVKDLNHFYLQHAALWEKDSNFQTFEWITFQDTQNSIICYLRKGIAETLLCVHNFTPQYHSHYFISSFNIHYIEELFNTDSICYGGSGKNNNYPETVKDINGHIQGVRIEVAPLATMIFKVSI